MTNLHKGKHGNVGGNMRRVCYAQALTVASLLRILGFRVDVVLQAKRPSARSSASGAKLLRTRDRTEDQLNGRLPPTSAAPTQRHRYGEAA